MKGFGQIILIILVAIIAVSVLLAVSKFFFGGGVSGGAADGKVNADELVIVVRESKYYVLDKEVSIDTAITTAKEYRRSNPNSVVYMQDEKARIQAWDALEGHLRSEGISPQPRSVRD